MTEGRPPGDSGPRKAVRRSVLGLVAPMLLAAACGSEPARVADAPKTPSKVRNAFASPFVPKLRAVPDVDGSLGLVKSEVGLERRIVSRMRIVTRADGSIERASDLLPAGKVSSVDLPARLGGGIVFALAGGRGTQLWRADSWLAPLVPLATLSQVADSDAPIVVGFDRLYVRLRSQNELVAIDPRSGALMPLGPLPPAPALGDMVFSDGWRAVVEADLRGILATFDAGATWRRLPISRRVRAITVDGDEPIVAVEGGEYRLSESGNLTFSPQTDPPRDPVAALLEPRDKPEPGEHLVLGKRPLRTALESGFPDSMTTAVVARAGALARVSLIDGRVLAMKRDVVPETMDCQAIRLGESFGFVCGEVDGKTLVLEHVAPLGVRPVLSFDDPRRVSESGQGAIVVQGTCENGQEVDADVRAFCIRERGGNVREIRVRGNLGAERVVSLLDGRVVVLVPPRAGALGQLSVIEGASARHLPLKLPEKGPVVELERGLWLEGFQQTDAKEISGWVDAGGSTVGVRVALDGTVSVGELVTEDLGVLVSGPFGLALGDRGRGLETSDFGKTWKDVDLVQLKGETRVRKCGPVGCALPGLLRIGWGDPAVPNDLADAPDPPPVKVPPSRLTSQTLSGTCTLVRREPKAKAGKPPVIEGTAMTGWTPLEGYEAPPLKKGELGMDVGSSFDAALTRLYAWGKKDADWSRTGRIVARFADRFSMSRARSTAITAAPFADENIAAEILGTNGMGPSGGWSAFADPSGSAVLFVACRGRPCTIFSLEAERPAVLVRPSTLAFSPPRPFASSTVRIGDRWLYLGEGSVPDRLGIYEIEGGVVGPVTEIARPHPPRGSGLTPPRLVRKSDGSGLGLLFGTRDGPFDKRGKRFVAPIDLEQGVVGDPVAVGDQLHLAGPCQGRHGWLAVLAASEISTDLDVGTDTVDNVELRVRLGENFACVEAGVGVVTLTKEGPKPPPGPKGAAPEAQRGGFPLFVRDRNGERAELACRPAPLALKP